MRERIKGPLLKRKRPGGRFLSLSNNPVRDHALFGLRMLGLGDRCVGLSQILEYASLLAGNGSLRAPIWVLTFAKTPLYLI